MEMKGEKADRGKCRSDWKTSTREQMQLQLLFASGGNRMDLTEVVNQLQSQHGLHKLSRG